MSVPPSPGSTARIPPPSQGKRKPSGGCWSRCRASGVGAGWKRSARLDDRHAACRDDRHALPAALLRPPLRRAQLRALEPPADSHAHLEGREAGAQAAPRPPAEGKPGVGVRRVVADEALRAELL